MAEKFNKLIIDVFGKEYELAGGGGIPPADSIGSEQVKDGSLGKKDMDNDVNEGLDELNNIGIEDKDIEDIFFPDGDVPADVYDGIEDNNSKGE